MTGLLLDKKITIGLCKVATGILSKHFNYDIDSLARFQTAFSSYVNYEHALLKENSTDDFKHEIWGNPSARLEFTACFVGYQLCKVLYEHMNFTDQEIEIFEEILVKYIKVCEPDEKQDR
jgi:hypothetical protein